jgi:RecT family
MSDNQNALVERKVNREIADTIAVDKAGISFKNAGEVMEYARLMAASGSAVPRHLRGQPGACLGIIDDAIRFRLNPYALARQSYFVNDQLAYQAAVFMALINTRAPLKTRPDIRFDGEGPERRCIVVGTFRDGAAREYKSPRIADIQPKNSPLWKTDPDQQLAYSGLRAWARRWCPEVIMGIHDVDELREAAMTDVTPSYAEATEGKPVLRSPSEAGAPTSLDHFAAIASEIAQEEENREQMTESRTQAPQASQAAETAEDAGEPAEAPKTASEEPRDWFAEGAEAFHAGKPRRAPAAIRTTDAGIQYTDGWEWAKGKSGEGKEHGG